MEKRLLCTLLMLCTICIYCPSGNNNDTVAPDILVLTQWKAGMQVSQFAVKQFGIEHCFVAEKINDAVFARMWKKSFKENCTVKRSDLRYLKVLHYTIEGKTLLGEMICNKAVANDLIDIFRSLYEARYPIERMVLIDNYNAKDEASMTDNNTSCFNFRVVAGTKKLSAHSRGLAVDINTLYNPCVRKRPNGTVSINPHAGQPYINRLKKFPYKIERNDLCCKLFKQHGFTWGGDWRRVKDYQHFEKAK